MGGAVKGDKVRLIGVGGVRAVAECGFDFLHMEMVHYFAVQVSQQDSSATAEVQAAKLQGKLEGLGWSVGHRLADRYTKDLSFLVDQLDVIKFLCKDLWLALFSRQVDKLQTNHRGVYVLHDTAFRLLLHCHALQGMQAREVEEQGRLFLAFSVGLVRGALSNLGLNAAVKADISKGIAVTFTITDTDRVKRAEEQPTGANTTTTTSTSAQPTHSHSTAAGGAAASVSGASPAPPTLPEAGTANAAR